MLNTLDPLPSKGSSVFWLVAVACATGVGCGGGGVLLLLWLQQVWHLMWTHS